MSIRIYLLILAISTIIAWVGWVLVLFYLPPNLGFWPLFLFFISLLIALCGTITFPGFFFRYKFLKFGLPANFLRTALRQALLFSILIVCALMLQGEKYLTLLTAILLITGLVFLEFFFISKNPKHQ